MSKISDLENQPQDVQTLKEVLAKKEEQLKQAQNVGNKRQGMVQQMLAVETKLKAQIAVLNIKTKNAAAQGEQGTDVNTLTEQLAKQREIANKRQNMV